MNDKLKDGVKAPDAHLANDIVLDNTIQDLNGISGSLDSEMPQVSILLAQVQTLLKQVQDVMTGLKNNPLLKNGVQERAEQQAATPKLREENF